MRRLSIWHFWRRKQPPQEQPALPAPASVVEASVAPVAEPVAVVEAIPVEPGVVEPIVVEPIVVEAANAEPIAMRVKEPPPPAVAPPSPTPALPALTDANEAKARALARRSYFAPSGYVPFAGRSPRLLAPGGLSPLSLAGGDTTSAPRHYFAHPSAAGQGRASTQRPGVVDAIHPADAAFYFLCRDNDPRLDGPPGTMNPREPELLSRALKLRDKAVENWLAGRAPWSVADFHGRAMELAGHTGTALLLCHDVALAFARGGTRIPWIKTARNAGEYSDGARSFQARQFHPQAILRANPLAPPSMFHLLFSAQPFGLVDAGDWRRYFASAALAWYIAAGHADAPAARTGPLLTQWTARLQAAAPPMEAPGGPAAAAWRFANTASFAELAAYGRSPAANRRVAHIHEAGARFGLEAALVKVPEDAAWRVPSEGAPARSIARSSLPSLATRAHTILVCTIDEGIACRPASSDWSDTSLQPAAEQLVEAIGWNVLDHAAGRQAILRCAPPPESGGAFTCEVDLGEGYQPWAVS